LVDRVLWNEGTLDELSAEVDAALDEAGLSRG
jgi:hypothetical protein